MLSNIFGYILDMDGVFFKEYHLLPGAKDIIKLFKEKGIPFIFLSNITEKTPEELHTILLRKGIFVDKSSIITPANLITEYLQEYYPTSQIKVFGSNALKSYIYKYYPLGAKDIAVDIVVIGMEPNISISDLSYIRKLIEAGKKVIFTNPDYYSFSNDGFNFDCGVMLEIFKSHFKEEPLIIGKPSQYAFEKAIQKLNIPRNNIAMVGDTYETDIKGALKVGILPIHLQTTQNKTYNTVNLDTCRYKDLQELCSQIKKL